MKKRMLYHIAVTVLFLVAGSLSASAQSQESRMTIRVPFDFQVGKTLLPAGNYVVKRDTQTPSLVRIQSLDRKVSVVFNTLPHSVMPQQNLASLVFKEYDQKHFLSDVRFSGYGSGYSLTESKAERQLAKAVKARKTPEANKTNN
jgi:hypothetical protein